MSKHESKLDRRALKLVLAGALLTAGLLTVARARASQDLPAGPALALVRDKCTTCHEADLITQQRLSRPGWTREVEKMIRWGAEMTESEKAAVTDYLVAHFPATAPARAKASVDAGRAIFEAKCLVCHEADLTAQQRLSRPGWTREVEKMIRWGADVSDAEKGPLVDYLAQTYGSH
jgi:cytochrome c5